MISENDINVIESIVREAGREILEVYEQSDFSIEIKDDASPVTAADLKSNQVIRDGLLKLGYDYPYLSEEEYVDGEKLIKSDIYWLVDPLDGTKEFINRNGEFAVCIALVKETKAVFGMVYAPVSDTLFYALKSKGAYKVVNGCTSRIEVNSYSEDQEAVRITVSRSHRDSKITDYAKTYKKPDLIAMGSILKLTMIAEGLAEIYPRLDNMTSAWDIAAGQIILEEAGGEVVLISDGSDLTYDVSKIKNPPFIARAKKI